MGAAEVPCGPYPLDEVLSSLRKTVKLRLLPDAVYWLTVLLERGPKHAARIAAKQLLIVASEDVYDESVMIRAWVVYETVGVVSETDALYFLVARMCDEDVPRWWESDKAREVDRLWSASLGELERDPRPVPSYALDRHTRRGWQVRQQQGHFDDRFSGTDLGRMKTSYLWLRDGHLDPDADLDSGFWVFWRERQELEGVNQPERGAGQEPLWGGEDR